MPNTASPRTGATRKKGGSNFKSQKYDEKIAWLRQLLAWKTDVADAVVGPGRTAARMGRKAQGHDARRPHLRADAAGARARTAGGRHADRLRLPPAQRCRSPLPRRAHRWRDGAAQYAAEKRPDLRDHHRQGRAAAPRGRRATGSVPATRSAAARAPRSAPGSMRWTWTKRWPMAARWSKSRCSAKARRPSTWKRWRTSWALPRSTICSSRWARTKFSLRHVEAALHDTGEAAAGRGRRRSSTRAARRAWSRAPSRACWWWAPRG